LFFLRRAAGREEEELEEEEESESESLPELCGGGFGCGCCGWGEMD
jgi:hypothetical protein